MESWLRGHFLFDNDRLVPSPGAARVLFARSPLRKAQMRSPSHRRISLSDGLAATIHPERSRTMQDSQEPLPVQVFTFANPVGGWFQSGSGGVCDSAAVDANETQQTAANGPGDRSNPTRSFIAPGPKMVALQRPSRGWRAGGAACHDGDTASVDRFQAQPGSTQRANIDRMISVLRSRHGGYNRRREHSGNTS